MNPTEKQQKAFEYLIDDEVEFLGFGGAAGGGKSYLGCSWLMQFGHYFPGTRYFIGRDSLKDTKASVLKTWSKLSHELKFVDYKFSDNYIKFSNGSEIELLDLSYYPQKDPLYERFGSKEYTAGWIEEAAPVHFMAFETLKTRIGRWKNKEYGIKKKILCTFNPRKTWVDTTFYRPYASKKETPETRFIPSLAKDNPYLPDDYIKTLENLKDKATKERLLHGNFDYDDDPTALINYESILNLYRNSHVVKTGKRYIIVDAARYGSDKAVIGVWDGLVLIDLITFDVSATTDIQNAITALRSKYQVPASNCLCDEDGVGGGIVDNLHIEGFLNNGRPKNNSYQNQKTECGYKLSEYIDQIYIECEISDTQKGVINQELGQLKTYDSDKDNKLRILPKEKIKENIGRSPDYLDMFTMRMYYETSKVENVPFIW